MEHRYALGESPSEVNEAFARCAAAGEVLLDLTDGAAPIDRLLCAIFSDFGQYPDSRGIIETGLAALAKIALAGAASTSLDDSGNTALDAARALAAGDPGPAAALAIEFADRAGLKGESHRLLARWAWTLLSDVSSAGSHLSGAAALEAAANVLDASANDLRNATRH
ncbi:MAG: hypothetical protein P4L80_12085 [Xanthobacteraceae bacterium]|nr:hypothetical protein [Xanthobacteraceae bacterium]